MQSHHPDNERIKRRYLTYLKEARGFSEDSLDQVAHRYETYTKFRDCRAFHVEQVRAFKQHLRDQRSQRTGESLSHATIYSTLGSLKAFFMWVAGQPGFKSRFSFGDWDYSARRGLPPASPKRIGVPARRHWIKFDASSALCHWTPKSTFAIAL
jgi:integrase/recombinase XerD